MDEQQVVDIFEVSVFEDLARVFLARGQRVFKLVIVERVEDS
jgi:hypothetical protein